MFYSQPINARRRFTSSALPCPSQIYSEPYIHNEGAHIEPATLLAASFWNRFNFAKLSYFFIRIDVDDYVSDDADDLKVCGGCAWANGPPVPKCSNDKRKRSIRMNVHTFGGKPDKLLTSHIKYAHNSTEHTSKKVNTTCLRVCFCATGGSKTTPITHRRARTRSPNKLISYRSQRTFAKEFIISTAYGMGCASRILSFL